MAKIRIDQVVEVGVIGLAGYLVWSLMSSSSNTSSSSSPLDALAQAIQAHEGWTPGSVSFRNNNPGNLKYAGQSGATGADASGFAIFPDYATGFQALKNQLALDASRNPSWTLPQFFSKYLGGDPYSPEVTNQGDPFAYAASVANKLGVYITTTLGQIING